MCGVFQVEWSPLSKAAPFPEESEKSRSEYIYNHFLNITQERFSLYIMCVTKYNV